VKTAGGGAGQFACNGLTPAQCATNLLATYTATPCVGITPICLDGTCSNGIVAYGITPGASSYDSIVSSAPGGITVTSGVDGSVAARRYSLLTTNATASPYLWSSNSDRVGILNSAGTAGCMFQGVDANGCTVLNSTGAAGGILTATQVISTYFGFASSTYMTAPADGQLKLRKNTDVGSITLDAAPTVKGQTLTVTSAVANCTFAASSTCSTSAYIPLGASIISSTARVTTASTAQCTAAKIGFDYGPGLDDDQLSATFDITTLSTTVTPASATADLMGTCLKAGGCLATVTGIGGTGVCANAVVAVTTHYIAATAATSN
jgi:hypothetical protein